MNDLENKEFCPVNPAAECGSSCSGPSGVSRVFGSEIILTCSDGYENSTKGSTIISKCKESADGTGKWELSDNCKSMRIIFGFLHMKCIHVT